MVGIEVPQTKSIIVGGGQEHVILVVDHQVDDRIRMPFEHLDDSILVDRPVQHQVVLLGGHQHRTVVVGMGDLLDLVVLHVELAVALSI